MWPRSAGHDPIRQPELTAGAGLDSSRPSEKRGATVRVMVLGGDGYLGWPRALYLAARGNDVIAIDNFARRTYDSELATASLVPITDLDQRTKRWREVSGRDVEYAVGDINDYEFLTATFRDFAPDAIVHF